MALRRRAGLGENGYGERMSADAATPSSRPIAEGADWRVVEVTCRAGPADPVFEERHDWTSIGAVLEGTFTYRTVQGRALMTPGGMLLGRAGACFECGHEHGRGDRCVAFHFAPALFEETVAGLKGARRTRFERAALPPLHSLLPLLDQAANLAETPNPLGAEQLALSVAGLALALNADGEEPFVGARDLASAADAVHIIEARYAEPLTIAGLARDVGLSRRRFAAVFKRAVGASPYNYILNRRLRAAAGRLRACEGSVLHIALDCGFGDLSEFTRGFCARFGRPPGAYRRGTA